MIDPVNGGIAWRADISAAVMMEFLWRAGSAQRYRRYSAAVELRSLEHVRGRDSTIISAAALPLLTSTDRMITPHSRDVRRQRAVLRIARARPGSASAMSCS